MKAIILAAGEGKRMRPLTLTTPKPMLKILGKPLLERLIESLPEEITEIILVVGYRGEQIEAYFGNTFAGRSVSYVWQHEQKGTGHALMLCKDFIQPTERFLFMVGDDLHSPDALKKLLSHDHGVLVSVHENPQRFGVIEIDSKNRVIGFEEAPEKPKSNLVSLAVFVLSGRIFKYAQALSRTGEYWSTDQIRLMMADHTFFVERSDFWIPVGYPHDLEYAEEMLRKKYRIGPGERRHIPVIILAGGKGTRMPEDEKHLPKCLVDIAGKPMLARQLDELRRQGFTDITLSLGYKADMVIAWLKVTHNDDVRYVVESEPLGTGGGIRLALGGRREPCIAINCDDLADINLSSLMRYGTSGSMSVLSVMEIDDARTFGRVECDENLRVCTFKEKDPEVRKAVVSIGHYYLQPDIFDDMPKQCSIERDVFPRLAAEGRLIVHRHLGNYWVTANNADQLKSTREYFSKK